MRGGQQRKILADLLARKRQGSRKWTRRRWFQGGCWLVVTGMLAVAFGCLQPLSTVDFMAVTLAATGGLVGAAVVFLSESDRQLEVVVEYLDEGSMQRRIDELATDDRVK